MLPLLNHEDVKLCDPKAKMKYQCYFGEHLMRKPIQTGRGEIACGECYREEKTKRNDGKCPIDGENISIEFEDKGREREILHLQCCCSYDACSWKGALKDREAHQEKCEHVPVKCRYCCQWISPVYLSSHLRQSCPKSLTNGCLFEGCPYKAGTVESLEDHLRNDTILHAYLQSAAIIDMKEQLRQQTSLCETLMSERDQQRHEMKAMEMQMEEYSNLIKTKMENLTEDVRFGKLVDRVKKIEEKQNTATNSSTNIQNQDANRLSNEVILINKSVADLDLRFQLFENTSHNGQILWKIDNVETRMKHAVTGNITALHSAPAFTDVNKYKFCARLYLNGDGLGRGKYLSLFLVMMKSEYDSLLSWPFSGKVYFKLINQAGKSHIEDSFEPDARSSSFVKPTKQMNIAAGCPRLVTIEQFKKEGFIKDDSMFIEIIVTSTNETPLLP